MSGTTRKLFTKCQDVRKTPTNQQSAYVSAGTGNSF